MRKAKYMFIAALFIFSTPIYAADRGPVVETAYNCTTSSTVITGMTTPAVRFLLIQNNSDTDIYFSFSGTAALNTGHFLAASGGAVLFDVFVPNQPLACIHGGSGNKQILVTKG